MAVRLGAVPVPLERLQVLPLLECANSRQDSARFAVRLVVKKVRKQCAASARTLVLQASGLSVNASSLKGVVRCAVKRAALRVRAPCADATRMRYAPATACAISA